MRPGQDRHEFADVIMSQLFPDGAPVIRGIALGTSIADVIGREGPGTPGGGAYLFRYEVEDPHEHGRRIEVKAHVQVDLVTILTACVYSSNKLDVDAPYRVIREHLEACHGRPGKEVTGVLKFVYQVAGPYPSVTSICRFKDANQENVLEIATRLADGQRIQGGPGGRKPAG